jgi:hypothetical protein
VNIHHLELIYYVANGLGIGVSVATPNKKLSPKARGLQLEGFPPGAIGALWRGRQTPPLRLSWMNRNGAEHMR